MICPHCGNNNKAGTTFCGKCGEKMPNITDLFSVSDDLPKGSQQSLFANNTNKETNASFKALDQNSKTKNFVNTSNTYSSETYHKTISNSDTTRTKNMSTKIESISKETNNSFIKDSSTSPLADVTSSIVKNTAKINTKSN